MLYVGFLFEIVVGYVDHAYPDVVVSVIALGIGHWKYFTPRTCNNTLVDESYTRYDVSRADPLYY